MLNYEKIKLGKCLTKNQKRIREIYLKHKVNLEGGELPEKYKLNNHKVRLHEYHNISVSCSRKIDSIYVAYDGKQKENIQVLVETVTTYSRSYRWKYPNYSARIFIVLGKQNIIIHKNHNYAREYYNNIGIQYNMHIEVNYRKSNLISLGEFDTQNLINKGGI